MNRVYDVFNDITLDESRNFNHGAATIFRLSIPKFIETNTPGRQFSYYGKISDFSSCRLLSYSCICVSPHFLPSFQSGSVPLHPSCPM